MKTIMKLGKNSEFFKLWVLQQITEDHESGLLNDKEWKTWRKLVVVHMKGRTN